MLHIAPAHNRDFRTVTSPALRHLGARATEVWARLVREPDRFCSIGTEAMFGPILHSQAFPDLRAWQKYITARYAWVVEETTRLNELLEKVTASNLHSEVDDSYAALKKALEGKEYGLIPDLLLPYLPNGTLSARVSEDYSFV